MIVAKSKMIVAKSKEETILLYTHIYTLWS